MILNQKKWESSKSKSCFIQLKTETRKWQPYQAPSRFTQLNISDAKVDNAEISTLRHGWFSVGQFILDSFFTFSHSHMAGGGGD